MNITLYIAVSLYALGTLAVLAGLYNRSIRLQQLALGLMIGGFVVHTVWIGMVCSATEHPPLTNLPEIAAFIAWLIFAVELFLFIRYRVHAAAFFVYPLILMLMFITVLIRAPFAPADPALDSNLFVGHLLLSTAGIAALFIGLAFFVLYRFQERSLKSKRQGRLFEWIPSLQVCEVVSYRALAIGFAIYTTGLLAGFLWSYRTRVGSYEIRSKEIAAVVAWVLFAALLQSYNSGTLGTRKNLFISAAAFVSILIAILGVQHV